MFVRCDEKIIRRGRGSDTFLLFPCSYRLGDIEDQSHGDAEGGKYRYKYNDVRFGVETSSKSLAVSVSIYPKLTLTGCMKQCRKIQ